MNELEIILTEKELPDGKIPAGTAQYKRINMKTGRFYDSPNIAKARRFYNFHFSLAKVRAGIKEPIHDPISLAIDFEYKAPRKMDINAPKQTRPDLDNAVKLIQDCLMSSGLIQDDSLIFAIHISKTYRAKERVKVKIYSDKWNEWKEIEDAMTNE